VPHESSFEHLEGPVLVSSCLLGISPRYDGTSKVCKSILKLSNIVPISICPEMLGSLPVPRPSACFSNGDGRQVIIGKAKVLNMAGKDVTESFLQGAEYCCRIASAVGARYAILKEGSPSCGTHRVWIDDKKQEGIGVAAAMLERHGIRLLNEDGLEL
jgi:uncharacterized protein YbbK (DUF523 family)